MTRAMYDQYIHEFTDARGVTRYAVGEWSEEHAEYTRPMDARERELTGCFAYFAKRPEGLGGYRTRRQALRRARYLYGQQED